MKESRSAQGPPKKTLLLRSDGWKLPLDLFQLTATVNVLTDCTSEVPLESSCGFDTERRYSVEIEVRVDSAPHQPPGLLPSLDRIWLHWGVTTVEQPSSWLAPSRSLECLSYFEWNDTAADGNPLDSSVESTPHDSENAGADGQIVLLHGAARNQLLEVRDTATAVLGSAPRIELSNMIWPSHQTEATYQSLQLLHEPFRRAKLVFSGLPLLHNGFASTKLPRTLEFVILVGSSTWIKQDKANFSLPIHSYVDIALRRQSIVNLQSQVIDPARLAQAQEANLIQRSQWSVPSGDLIFDLSTIALADNPKFLNVFFFADTPHPILLHWGVVDSTSPTAEWHRPDIRCLGFKFEGPDPFCRAPLDNRRSHKTDKASVGSTETNVSFPSQPAGSQALQTTFAFSSASNGNFLVQFLILSFEASAAPVAMKFVLKELRTNNWFHAAGKSDFLLDLPTRLEYMEARKAKEGQERERLQKEESEGQQKDLLFLKALKLFRESRPTQEILDDYINFQCVKVSESMGELDVAVEFVGEKSALQVSLFGCLRVPMRLHWGVLSPSGTSRQPRIVGAKWSCPPAMCFPEGTVTEVTDPERSCESDFLDGSSHPQLRAETSPNGEVDANIACYFKRLDILIPAKLQTKGSQLDSGIAPTVAAIVFVLREVNGSRWFKQDNSNSDIIIRLLSDRTRNIKSLPNPELLQAILDSELDWEQMTLMHRFDHIRSIISHWDEITNPTQDTLTNEKSNFHFWAWIFVWSRFSFLGLLDWQRNYNTQPRHLTHSMDRLTAKLAELWLKRKPQRRLICLVLATIPRGGSQGQAIRDRILDIMHRHRIPEHGNYFEQWHQKLHNNTTPDDVAICSATLQFLKSHGNLEEFHRVLGQYGITRERLASYDRNITLDPYIPHCDVAQLIADLEGYLDVLTDVHDSLDLKKSFHHAARHLDYNKVEIVDKAVRQAEVSGLRLSASSTASQLPAVVDGDAVHSRYTIISQARRCVVEKLLDNSGLNPDACRDLLYLESALEQQQLVALQSTAASQFNIVQLTEQLFFLIESLAVYDPLNLELQALKEDFKALGSKCARQQFSGSKVESHLMLKALADRFALAVGSCTAEWQNLFSLKAEFLGSQVGVDQRVINVFVDEVLRGSLYFGVSITLKRLEPKLRAAAQLPPWQIISPADIIRGRLQSIGALANIQSEVFDEPTILLCGAVSGEEDIPAGIQGVLVRSSAESPDILSHVSVRARNAHVLLAVCFDSDVVNIMLEPLVGNWVELSVLLSQSTVVARSIDPPDLHKLEKKLTRRLVASFDRSYTQLSLMDDLAYRGEKAQANEMDLETASEHWVLPSSRFSKGSVGSKSLNLSILRTRLAREIIVPEAVALPFGCFQKALLDQANRGVKERLKAELLLLTPESSNSEASIIFTRVQRLLQTELRCPAPLMEALRKCVVEVELFSRSQASADPMPLDGLTKWDGDLDASMWQSICGVWGSMFAIRPWVSLTKARVSYHHLNMAVLIQELLLPKYAFVLHSRNPFGENESEMYGEIVVGLGETLVGNYPGRSLSWKMNRNPSSDPEIVAFPSKGTGLRGFPSLIFRSDSNSEDLEGFAGAGLFESITTKAPEPITIIYSQVEIVTNHSYRTELLKRIGQLAFDIEDSFGFAMDVEGVVSPDGRLAVVQARPQV